MASIRAVTIDFHDTIAIAPAWFALEVRQLPALVLDALADAGAIDAPGHRLSQARMEHMGPRMERAARIYRALREEIQEHGREQDALSCVQHTLRAMEIAVPDSVVEPAIDALMASVRDGAEPRPGIHEAVRAFRAAGVPLAVVSNAVYHPFLEWCLEEWGLTDAFTAIISSASCGYYKSHEGIYRCALDALGTPPEQTVHIGDSYRYDVEAAHRLGMRTVWLQIKGERPDPCVADLVVTDLDGLAPRVLSLR
jgi:HAD superfamily hydrolase (TIGR01509 family)